MLENNIQKSLISEHTYSRLALKSKNDVKSQDTTSTFGQALLGATTPSYISPTGIQSDTISLTSFIDNIDFTKFKSDPFHFGQFIAVETEVAPALKAAAEQIDTQEDPVPPSVESLFDNITAQIQYTKEIEVPNIQLPIVNSDEIDSPPYLTKNLIELPTISTLSDQISIQSSLNTSLQNFAESFVNEIKDTTENKINLNAQETFSYKPT